MFGKTALADSLLCLALGEMLNGSKYLIFKNLREKKGNFESQMYDVILNTIQSVLRISDQTALYEAAEQFLTKLYEEKIISEAAIKKSLGAITCKPIDDIFCKIFYSKMNEEIAVNQELTNWIGIMTNQEVLRLLKEAHNDVNDEVEEIKNYVKSINETINNPITVDIQSITNGIQDDKSYYLKKWESRLFLHTGHDDKPLTLKNTFIFPEYKLNGAIYDDLNKKLEKFIENEDILTILFGVPGMGKTSIVAYLANKYVDDEKMVFLRFNAFSNIGSDRGMMRAVCDTLGCMERDLEGHVLVLDGFDELKTGFDKHVLIKTFLLDIKNIAGLKAIITSRFNYIDKEILKGMPKHVIELIPYSPDKIYAYQEKIVDAVIQNRDLIKHNDVLGIPVILYMALAVGIDITEERSKCWIYEKIFSLDSGIYSRFGTFDRAGYDNGSHLVEYVKDKLHRIMQLFAFKIFENNEKTISLEEYKDLVNIELGMVGERNCEGITLDFPIRNLYDYGNGIDFVHKSIYEYFAAKYIYNEICKIRNEDAVKAAGILGRALKKNKISIEIKEYLQYEMKEFTPKDRGIFIKAFEIMLEKGMTYYSNERYDKILYCEWNVFYNVLEILHFWSDYIYLKNLDDLKVYCRPGVNLSIINLRALDLHKADLSGANLNGTNLSRSNLNGADLSGADLNHADLSRAELIGANLAKAKLNGANLDKANFIRANLTEAVFDFNNIKVIENMIPLNSHVYIECGGRLVKYEEYKQGINKM